MAPHLIGASIWHWNDQSINKTGKKPSDFKNIKSEYHKTGNYWINDSTYLDSKGFAGTDGIVFGNRELQSDYYQTKAVYSPVIINIDTINISKGKQKISIECENRYDFTNLNQLLSRR